VLLTASGCALPPARWGIPAGAERRFVEMRQVCHRLTDPEATRFDDCMNRRGFERESLWQRSWRGINGGGS
jgi:hypothetical protein